MPTPTENNEPTVAVIIPCHNHSGYLSKAINSVLDQDYPAKMLVVVDDGSTDNSYEVMCSFMEEKTQEYADEETGDIISIGHCHDQQNLPMIIVKRETARKQAAARNVGIQLAWQNADLFCPLDADDLFLPGKLNKCVIAYQQAPNFIGLVYNDVVIHDTRDNTEVREFREPYDRNKLEYDNIISNAPLISKEALAYSGPYDENLPPCEDWDLWLRITENFVAIHIPEALQQYTTTGENCTFTVPTEKWHEQRQIVHNKMLERKRLQYGESSK